jgi:hypothetical protein
MFSGYCEKCFLDKKVNYCLCNLGEGEKTCSTCGKKFHSGRIYDYGCYREIFMPESIEEGRKKFEADARTMNNPLPLFILLVLGIILIALLIHYFLKRKSNR